MAKIYGPPEDFEPAPSYDFKVNHGTNLKREWEWLSKLKEYCKRHGSGKHAGDMVYEGVADGKAAYMVFSLRPVVLIHIPLGDAYQSRWAHKWNAQDVKRMAMPLEREYWSI